MPSGSTPGAVFSVGAFADRLRDDAVPYRADRSHKDADGLYLLQGKMLSYLRHALAYSDLIQSSCKLLNGGPLSSSSLAVPDDRKWTFAAIG